MEKYGRITVDQPRHRQVNPDSITDSIVHVALAVGIGCVGILFAGIIIVSSAI